MSALRVSDEAPEFALSDGEGTTVKLSDFRGGPVILYFYPKDDTPGCTREACSFQAARPRLARRRAVVLGISRDSVESHRRFAKKFHLAFPLLSDPEALVCKAYGVYKQKSLYGRTYWGIERTTFLIDAQGRIAAIFPKVSVDGHTDEVLQALDGSSARQAPAAAGRTRPA
jgi:peroxiredoxin Q/BCP